MRRSDAIFKSGAVEGSLAPSPHTYTHTPSRHATGRIIITFWNASNWWIRRIPTECWNLIQKYPSSYLYVISLCESSSIASVCLGTFDGIYFHCQVSVENVYILFCKLNLSKKYLLWSSSHVGTKRNAWKQGNSFLVCMRQQQISRFLVFVLIYPAI